MRRIFTRRWMLCHVSAMAIGALGELSRGREVGSCDCKGDRHKLVQVMRRALATPCYLHQYLTLTLTCTH